MINEIGNRYGKLTVIKYDHTDKKHGAYWLCACDCGMTSVVKGNRLRNGKTKSCGCMKVETQKNFGYNTREYSSARMKVFNKTEEHRQQCRDAATKHGGSNERLYSIWSGMKERCSAKSGDHYTWYSSKGIKVCEEWSDYAVFRKWAYENGYHTSPEGTAYKDLMSIDRIDPTKGYCPDNCRWVTISENMIARNQYYADQRRSIAEGNTSATHSE